MLTLPIKKQWYDMILSGEKKEEYRKITPYYTKRFINAGLLDPDGKTTTNKFAMIALRNGYSRSAPTLTVTVRLMFGEGRKEWGAGDGEFYYILEIVDKHLMYHMSS